jgi:hypothetical protein
MVMKNPPTRVIFKWYIDRYIYISAVQKGLIYILVSIRLFN